MRNIRMDSVKTFKEELSNTNMALTKNNGPEHQQIWLDLKQLILY